MVHFLLDTNIILDFLTGRKPFSIHAAHLFSAADTGKIKLYVSAISFNNTYNVIRQSIGHKKAIHLLDQLGSMVQTIPLNSDIINKSIKSGYSDFEDGIQYFSALSEKRIQALVTRNSKDYKSKELLILEPDMALQLASTL
jgi:predicted nucleic acid-binding protein